jgi:hypothetical protein
MNMNTGTYEAGLPARMHHDMHKNPHSRGFASTVSIIPKVRGTSPGPQVFVVEQSPNSIACAHFHPVDQFQVVVAGGGQLGRHDIAPYTVHYSNPYTGYGPIAAGSEGLSYVTLRRVADVHPPFYLPDAKVHLQPGERLNLTGEQIIPGEPAKLDHVACEPVIAPRPDGVGAWLLRIPPNTAAAAPGEGNGGGQFRLVIAGGMKTEAGVLPRLGCAFTEPAESGREITAGPDGLEVLVMQFSGTLALGPAPDLGEQARLQS